MLVKVKRGTTYPGGRLGIGEEVELPKDIAQELIAMGKVEPIEPSVEVDIDLDEDIEDVDLNEDEGDNEL